MLRDLLEREGFEVDTADSAEAGLDQLATCSADIVFMDHMLPGMQGLDAVRRIRSDGKYRDLPVIMYTSQEGDAFARMARAAGADDIYLKTADTEGLVTVLQRLGLAAERSREPAVDRKVVALRDRLESGCRIDDVENYADGTAVVEELLPVLEQHRVRLRQDLLAEFAILERHEERMRRELAAHVEAMTRRAASSFADAVQEAQVRREARRRSASRRWLAAAAVLAAVAFGMALGLTIGAPEPGVAMASGTYVGTPD